MSWLDTVRWNADGLVPVITQEAGTNRVLMHAWMNREALAKTAEAGVAVYWSRSRRRLWKKGEESGHVQRVREIVPLTDVYQTLIKAPVFGMIIAMAGCYQGLLVEGNAEEVGLRTTTAVVQGIFLVIVLDAFFAVFFTEVGWL